MWQHHGFGVTSRTTCVDKIAALARCLILHPLVDDSITNLRANLIHSLGPGVNRDSMTLLREIYDIFVSFTLSEQEKGFDPRFMQLITIDKETGFETQVRVTDNDFCIGVLGLVEAHFRWIGRVDISENTVGKGCTHDARYMLWCVGALNQNHRSFLHTNTNQCSSKVHGHLVIVLPGIL